MSDVIHHKDKLRHPFTFHGEGASYFIICLVNLFLSVITLGIYAPWAMVRCRRYIYENTELHGVRFNYHATGGALIISWILMTLLYLLVAFIASVSSEIVSVVIFIMLLMVIPFFIVKSLQYQAIMMSLNNVRFAFRGSMGEGWRVIAGLPIVLIIAQFIVLMIFAFLPANSLEGLIFKLGTIIVLSMLMGAVMNGVLYSRWMQFIGNNASFGIHRFNSEANRMFCVKAFLIAICIMIPFAAVIFYIMSSSMFGLIFSRSLSSGISSDAVMGILTGYFVYLLGALVAAAYIWMSMRNHFMNTLSLADGKIRFQSTISFHAMVLQFMAVFFVSLITLGLAYPWMKMRYLRFMANNSFVIGDLDEITLADHDDQVDTGAFAVIARGALPVTPFI